MTQDERLAALARRMRERELLQCRAPDWSEIDARIAAAFDEQDEVIGIVLAEERERMREEITEAVGELRAELTIARAHEAGRVIDMPSPLLRKRGGTA
jgi:hypothetical protein